MGQNNFTGDQLKAAEKLIALGHADFDPAKLTAGARLIALGQNNFTGDQLKAAEKLRALVADRDFSDLQLRAAQNLIDKDFADFTEEELYQLSKISINIY